MTTTQRTKLTATLTARLTETRRIERELRIEGLHELAADEAAYAARLERQLAALAG